MSQEKVNKYKEQKANRKEYLKKEKSKNTMRGIVAGVIAVVLIGWVGYSVYDMVAEHQPAEAIEVDYSTITDYQSELSATEAE